MNVARRLWASIIELKAWSLPKCAKMRQAAWSVRERYKSEDSASPTGKAVRSVANRLPGEKWQRGADRGSDIQGASVVYAVWHLRHSVSCGGERGRRHKDGVS
eukprot:4701335-Pleurochrysis_carterae.AAC.1